MASTRRSDSENDSISSRSSFSSESYSSADDSNLQKIRPYNFEPRYAENETRNNKDSEMEDEEIMNQRLQDLNW